MECSHKYDPKNNNLCFSAMKTHAHIAIALVLGILVFLIPRRGSAMNTTQNNLPRGIRNNNPGNLEASMQWLGMTGSDGRYAIFKDAQHGIRALLINLHTYMETYGLRTISGIINRWAPPSENNTAAYIASVAKQTSLNPEQTLNYKSHALALAKAIVYHENGQNPYSESTFREAYQLAGKYL